MWLWINSYDINSFCKRRFIDVTFRESIQCYKQLWTSLEVPTSIYFDKTDSRGQNFPLERNRISSEFMARRMQSCFAPYSIVRVVCVLLHVFMGSEILSRGTSSFCNKSAAKLSQPLHVIPLNSEIWHRPLQHGVSVHECSMHMFIIGCLYEKIGTFFLSYRPS